MGVGVGVGVVVGIGVDVGVAVGVGVGVGVGASIGGVRTFSTTKPLTSVALPAGVVTETSRVPGAASSAMLILAVICVGLSTVKLSMLIPVPKFTTVAPLRLLPITITDIVFPGGAETGLSEVIVGAGISVVKEVSPDQPDQPP